MEDAEPDTITHDLLDEAELFDPNEPGIFDELDEEADMAAGRLIPHEDVVKWLESVGTDSRRPRPQSQPRRK